MHWLKPLCSFTTKVSCMAFTCLSLVQSPSGRLLTELELILIITFAFSGLSWTLILLVEHFNDILQLNVLTREKNSVHNSGRKKVSNGTIERGSRDSSKR